MKFLIVGRTASGKDSLKAYLESRYGWKFVKSYTTRPKRTPDEDTHIFISHEEAARIPQTDKVAITFIKNETETPDEYFATRQQIDEADGYIIDPKGIEVLLKNMPDECFEIIYLQACSEELREAAAIDRAKDKKKAKQSFIKRNDDEDEQFTQFEDNFQNGHFGGDNCQQLTVYQNDYTDKWLEQTAFRINTIKTIYHKLHPLVDDMIAQKQLETTEDDKILLTRALPNDDPNDKDDYRYVDVPLTKEQFIQSLYTDPEGLSTIVLQWIAHPTTHFENETRVKTQMELTFNDYIADVLESTKNAGTEEIKSDKSLKDLQQKISNKLVNDDTFWNTIDQFIHEAIHESEE